MSKINEYPQAVTINNNDLFVIDQESGGDHATKSASVSQIADKATSGVQSQIGDLSTLTTSVKSSLVGAVNEVVSGKQSRLYTKTISISGATGTAWTPHYYCDVDISSYFTGVDANAGILAVTINQQTSGGVLCAMLQGSRTIRLLNDQPFTNVVCNITCLYFRP